MDDLAFVFAAGEDKYDEQGLYLARSIARTNPDASIIVYVPNGESPGHEDELAEIGTIVRGEPTIVEYGISRKIDALIAAETAAESDYLLLLDTDTLVLDTITVHQSGKNLYLKPVDVGLQYWGRESESRDDWTEIATEANLPVPEWQHRSTFDSKPIPPYWNAGFVLTANQRFGKRWMQLVQDIYPNIPYEWHADQVALGLLSQEYDVEELDNRYNYPLHLRLRLRDDAKVIHYHNFHNLKKGSSHRPFLREIGMWDAVEATEYSQLRSDWRYLKRKFLPLNEEHTLERLYNRVIR
jgi:hypothetical protein